MSQKVTVEVAATLKKGDTLYHNILEFGGLDEDKTPATATVLGPMKRLPGSVEVFSLPIKRNYCGGSRGSVSRMSQDIWRTEPAKKVVARIHRLRTESVPEPAPVKRVRRTR